MSTFDEQEKMTGMSIMRCCLSNVDDVLIISHKPGSIADEIDNHYKIKPGSRGAPERYLGADAKVQTGRGQEVWSTSSF